MYYLQVFFKLLIFINLNFTIKPHRTVATTFNLKFIYFKLSRIIINPKVYNRIT